MAPARVAAWLLAAAVGCSGVHAREPQNVLPATGTIEYAFSPEDDAGGRVVRAIDAARAQVLVQAFSFTHERIAEALVRAARRGVDVRILADADQTELIERSVVRRLAAEGLAVFVDDGHLAAHNKVVVVDADDPAPTVITGSFNFTFAAQYRNAENLLILRGNPALAKAYRDNWERHRKHSTPVGAVP